MTALCSSSRSLTKIVALDCEMVGVGEHGVESVVRRRRAPPRRRFCAALMTAVQLARVAIVNGDGDIVFDSFVKPQENVVGEKAAIWLTATLSTRCLPLDYRTKFSGVREEDIANAPSFAQIQKKVGARRQSPRAGQRRDAPPPPVRSRRSSAAEFSSATRLKTTCAYATRTQIARQCVCLLERAASR